jgi:uncharacterized protein YecE (DUF72 family)
MPKIRIGTSGWHYTHWKGPFYPPDLPEKKFLAYYIEHFATVEINRTFYSLPDIAVFSDYAKLVPKSFLFAVKGSRFLTHVKRLKDPRRPLARLFNRIRALKEHLGPILFQTPPNWAPNPERLANFCKALPKGGRFAFEFRDPRWFQEETYAILRKHNAALCIYELDGFLSPRITTADFLYVRLHGPNGAYAGKYSKTALKKWAAFFRQAKRDVYCYFDNDEAGYAPKNALELDRMINRPCKE